MRSMKKAGLITIIIALTIIALILTYTFLPAYIKDRGNLYTDWEKAQWHLTNDDYDELLIEYDYVEGYKPNFTATNEFDNILKEYTEKEDITHRMGDVIPIQDTSGKYNEQNLQYLEERYRGYETEGDTLVIYVLYLNGEWKKSEVLGLSYGGTNIAIFMEMIRDSADRSHNLDSGSIESSVLIHEWGHLIGLVGRDYESEHESTEYQHHCTQEAGRCVMAASVQIKGDDGSEEPELPTDFCELCQEDIEKIRTMRDLWGPGEILTYIAMGGEFTIGVTWAVGVGVGKSKDEVRYNKEIYENEKTYGNETYSEENDYVKDDNKKYY
ncbi:MAG: hypothetical protein R6W73_10240 [Candidatus Saliniplasma sp.]